MSKIDTKGQKRPLRFVFNAIILHMKKKSKENFMKDSQEKKRETEAARERFLISDAASVFERFAAGILAILAAKERKKGE